MAKKTGLGRGLDALLGSAGPTAASHQAAGPTAIFELPVSELVQGQFQPRQGIDEDELADLVQSIRQQGVLQPILVRALTGAQSRPGLVSHEIVAGERRWRAAKLAGLATVPVVIRELDDQSALAIALIENLQRKDLNPIEIAESLLRLTEEFGLTHQQAADSVGRSRSSVTNLLRLLDLNSTARELLAAGKIDMGHARALLPLDLTQQAAVAAKICDEQMSVRQVESYVTELQQNEDRNTAAKQANPIDLQTRWLQKQLSKEAGLKVSFRNRADGSHAVNINFNDLEQLQDALLKIETLVGQIKDTAGHRTRDSRG